MATCTICKIELDSDRLEFLLLTKRPLKCIKCSTEVHTTGLMDYGHKTAPQLVILPNNQEVQRIAKRAFRRAR